jgi:hypothetical protein
LVVEEFRSDYLALVTELLKSLEQIVAPLRQAWEPIPATVPGGVLGDVAFLAVARAPEDDGVDSRKACS